jgi:hypothetical protein
LVERLQRRQDYDRVSSGWLCRPAIFVPVHAKLREQRRGFMAAPRR